MKYEWLDQYLLDKPGTEKDYKIEWGWHRYMVRGKLFAAVCSPRGMKDKRYWPRPSGSSTRKFSQASTATSGFGWPPCWTGICPTWY